jgi:hypothetical protein
MRAAILIAPFLLAACSGGGEQPGAVTADEARELNEAAEMLDANSIEVNMIDRPEAIVVDEQPGV